MKYDTVKSSDNMGLFQSLQMIGDSLEMDQTRIIAQFLAISSDYLRIKSTYGNKQ
jgi:hypothetical protein